MLNRTAHAHRIARQIEQNENCPVLSNDTIQFLEQSLTEYAIERLVAVRVVIGGMTLSATMKTRVLHVLESAISSEVQS